MTQHPPIEDLAARLEREREEVDRRYNAALTAVDRAIQSLPRFPDPPAAYDADGLTAVNRAWDILPAGAPHTDRSLKGRLRTFVWRMVGPPLEGQKHFNAALVDHLNRNVQAQHELPRALAAMIEELRREFEALVRFESLLVQYLQTITIYIDTKDRTLGTADTRERLAIAEQRLTALKRDVENLRPGGTPLAGQAASPATAATAEAATYVGFEDRFRGSQREISLRMEDYLPLLASASDVVDVGCGRGELLDLLKRHGVTARGVDVNLAMVELCLSRGLSVEAGDALGYLARQPDASIGGLVAIQVVEHFEPAYLSTFLETAYQKMRPGAPIILETINPACWMAFFETYIRDLTHQRPLHPETLRYLVQASGFQNVDVQFRQPVGEGDKLDRVGSVPAPDMASLANAINAHADKLNARLFSWMDYAVVARR
ncbi:MAG: class I SAM-dependent methyltransferase [Vicinamibacterales bacterium]|nr:class I SAM-dependent methyltransferase [Vicinamibacterales bacterium]